MRPTHLLDLPDEVLENIFDRLPYKDVADLRLVCHDINTICCSVLNSSFRRITRNIPKRYGSVGVPVADWYHHFGVSMRLFLILLRLKCTFGRHIEMDLCCFSPGEILDEVHRIRKVIKATPLLLDSTSREADRLMDMTNKAVKHFEEQILPTLPELSIVGADARSFMEDLGVACGQPYPTGDVSADNQRLSESAARAGSSERRGEELSERLLLALRELSGCKAELQRWRTLALEKETQALCACACARERIEDSDCAAALGGRAKLRDACEQTEPASGGDACAVVDSVPKQELCREKGQGDLKDDCP